MFFNILIKIINIKIRMLYLCSFIIIVIFDDQSSIIIEIIYIIFNNIKKIMIIINAMSKTISKSHSTFFIKSINTKNMKNNIIILKEQSQTINDINNMQQ